MASGFFCTACRKPFRGQPALELIATLRGKLEQKFKTDMESGEYCESCGKKIFPSIEWDKEDSE